jgi:hypothetical protein
MLLVVLKLTVPMFERKKTFRHLDRAATLIGCYLVSACSKKEVIAQKYGNTFLRHTIHSLKHFVI